MIEHFIDVLQRDEQYHTTTVGFEEQERVYRLMARETRTRRRSLMKELRQLVVETPAGQTKARLIGPVGHDGPLYVFLVVPPDIATTPDDYREGCQTLLAAYAQVARLQFPSSMDIIAIGMEPGDVDLRSEDIVYYDARGFGAEEAAEARAIQRETGILKRPKLRRTVTHEYPMSGRPARAPIRPQRNRPCPCGSGLKYKKCCWLKQDDT